jgi:7-cyano-7-deazaguanine synthase
MKKVVVLHSGGMDSSVCLLLAKEQGHEVVSLGISYGEPLRVELDYAARLCDRFGVQRTVLHIEWDKPVRSIPTDRAIDEMSDGVSPAFLPARNVVFLSLACAEAAGKGASEVWIGVNALDFSGYPDCRPEFIDAFQRMIVEAMLDAPKIVAPLISMSKREIALEACRLGLRKDDTWSCYQPVISSQKVEPCHRCDACILHDYAWEGLECS